MKSIPIFRDKTDLVSLPEIPSLLVDSFKRMGMEINGGNLTFFEKLQAVYRFMDQFGAFVSTFAVCSRGCSHCCRMDVQMGTLEAHYIEARTSAVADGTGEKVTMGHRTACPFLDADGACSIYEFRPFNCRTFHTLDDPKYCADGDESHQVYGSAGGGYGVGFYSSISSWLKGIEESEGRGFRDIRDWFPG